MAVRYRWHRTITRESVVKVIMSSVVIAATLFSGPASPAEADKTARSLIESGVAAYQQGGPEAAIKVWIKGSALEGNPAVLTQANVLRQVQDFYGKPVGLDIVKEYEAGPRTRIDYIALNYEKGAAYAKFQMYQTDSGSWIVTSFIFNTEANQVFPACLF